MKLLRLPPQCGTRFALKTLPVFNNPAFCTGLQRQNSLPVCLHHSLPQSRLSQILVQPQPRLFTKVRVSSFFDQRCYRQTLTTAASSHRPTSEARIVLGAKMFHSSTDSGGEVQAGSSKLQAMEVATNIFAHAVSSVLPHQMIEKVSYRMTKIVCGAMLYCVSLLLLYYIVSALQVFVYSLLVCGFFPSCFICLLIAPPIFVT